MACRRKAEPSSSSQPKKGKLTLSTADNTSPEKVYTADFLTQALTLDSKSACRTLNAQAPTPVNKGTSSWTNPSTAGHVAVLGWPS